MQAGELGYSLAMRLPTAIVELLDLEDGDEIEIGIAGDRLLTVDRDERRGETIARLKACNWTLPPVSSLTATRPMSAKVFLDTNILIYAVSPNDPRFTTAAGIIANGCVISVQVLNEFAKSP
jgi:antitoxin MazE